MMYARISHDEYNLHFGEKARDPRGAKIRFRIERETVLCRGERLAQKVAQSAVGVGCPAATFGPIPCFITLLQRDRDARGGTPARRIENVCGDAAHWGHLPTTHQLVEANLRDFALFVAGA